ncbi:hypothetical protein N7495_003803 [Penicillium taxi]|uniref:uncharacterized protein n=1 Tax=Penicillium taxi TaxID=168475 RepID=UPI002545338F|nr:uncharacterized protein N7495_003803 [Penicillium taxi]KAJ5899059.1 hypothetical protein N7495_003803 [Penicillium taxi]
MSEQWKSVARYWCKQCKTFIRDTRFERTQHDASPKHLNNMARFIRELAKKNESIEKEAGRAKSEVERLRNLVSGGSSSTDKNTQSTNAPSTKRTAVALEKPAPRPASAADRKTQMAQLAGMGIAVPDDFRRDMAIAGEWQTVSQKVIKTSATGEEISFGTHKRKQPDDDEETGPREYNGWGTKIKTYPSAQADDEDGDLDALIASTTTKKPKTAKISPKAEELKLDPALLEKKDGEILKKGGWVSIKREEPTIPVKQEDSSILVKQEEPAELSTPLEDLPTSLADENTGVEDVETTPTIVFKKRKAKVIRK